MKSNKRYGSWIWQIKELQKICKNKVTAWWRSTEEHAECETSEPRWQKTADEWQEGKQKNATSYWSEEATKAIALLGSYVCFQCSWSTLIFRVTPKCELLCVLCGYFRDLLWMRSWRLSWFCCVRLFCWDYPWTLGSSCRGSVGLSWLWCLLRCQPAQMNCQLPPQVYHSLELWVKKKSILDNHPQICTDAIFLFICQKIFKNIFFLKKGRTPNVMIKTNL